MNLRDQLLSNKPKTQPVDINGTTYYLRDATVGDMNHLIFEQRQWLIKQAEIEGVELPDEQDEGFDAALEQFGAKYSLARSIASRLCDENGDRLFDPNNVDDLNAIAALDSQVFVAFSNATTPPKALASEESSS
ncbi:hypothetical protein [Frederiksenia canicola]|uniref:Phage tail assembly chaperone n=1 Tax=Frederiksenia canicola TaxID=123824 RepID=A0AAE7C2L3_9PAST|nr:hypothetical protein [Frederiksenia canicola]QIM65267.1 hypothetical protein A4G17_07355 [Frederiksenia canicola]RPE96303.1 hypothetical protein EDC49_0693 [Frederiksenia canicola]